MTDLRISLLGLLSRHCRGPAAARKAWKVAEDLRALGLAAGPQAVLDVAADLRGQGYPVLVTAQGAAYIEERRRKPDLGAQWRAARRPRGAGHAVPGTVMGRALAEAAGAYHRRVKAASVHARAPRARQRTELVA